MWKCFTWTFEGKCKHFSPITLWIWCRHVNKSWLTELHRGPELANRKKQENTFDHPCHRYYTTYALVSRVVLRILWFLFLALDSVTKPRCRGCRTGYFCVGDGTEEKCGVNSPTEFSFGSAASCSPCPEGWVSEYNNNTVCKNVVAEDA